MEQTIESRLVTGGNTRTWKTLFIADKSSWSKRAGRFIQSCFPNTDLLFWERGDALAKIINTWEGDQIISFKSDLILPQAILDRTHIYSLNFHPAPPIYRGIGGYHYALLNGDQQFGVTCHHMVKEIDFGQIIETIYFPIRANDTASSLKQRSGHFCLELLQKIVHQYLLAAAELPVSEDIWGEELYTLKKLNCLIAKNNLINASANWLR